MHRLSYYEVTYIVNVPAHNMDEAVESAREAIADQLLEPDIVEEIDMTEPCSYSDGDCGFYEQEDED